MRHTFKPGLAMMLGMLLQSAPMAGAHAVAAAESPVVTHGVSAGDVTSHTAIIWSRADRDSWMNVRVRGPVHGEDGRNHEARHIRVTADGDFTGKILVEGLRPDTEYTYEVWFGDGHAARSDGRKPVVGRFRTAPEADEAAVVRLAWGGDVAGQNVCRDAGEGFPVFKTIGAQPFDFFIGLGDMIYADGTCESVGRYGNAQIPGGFLQAADMPNYWAHWKYNRADAGMQALLASMPYYAIWDDHEVVNDFGPLHDTRDTAPYTPGAHLMPLGLDAFLDYNPVLPGDNTPERLYRSVRWGKNLEMFILDTRQYRDANRAVDSADRAKTMLGREQLVWLKNALTASDATWKVIVSSVPMAIPTGGNGRDGWANYTSEEGFEQELTAILRTLQQNGDRNVVWLTTDVHFAEVFRFTPFAEDPGFQVYEFVTGPLNAGLFPNRSYDSTLNAESLFFYGPESAASVADYDQARPWFNYGTLAIDAGGQLTAGISDVNGNPVYQTTLLPQ